MLNLVLKDILIQKKTVFFSFFYVAFMIVAFQTMGPAMLPAGIFSVIYILLLTSCTKDEKNNSDVLINSLPIKRKNVVRAKYLSLLVFFLLGFLYYLVWSGLINALPLPIQAYPVTWEGLLGAEVCVCLMNGIFLPVFFKIGYMRARVLNFILFFGTFFGSSFLSSFILEHQDQAWAQGVLNFFTRQSDPVIFLVGTAFLLIWMGISLMLAEKFYHRREF